jgi:osmotically-inducible protein OsmY
MAVGLAASLGAASLTLQAQVNIDDIKQAERRDGNAPLADSDLAERVRSALLREPGLEPLKVDVEARAGHVYLQGVVRDAEQRSQASRAAARVAGVLAVTNNLGVTQPSPSTGQ